MYAVRQSLLRPGLPGTGHLEGAGRRGGGRLRLVHRLSLLHGRLSLPGPPFQLGTAAADRRGLNPDTHYLGNRPRPRGVVEKCHFCLQRTREGRLPACQEACPTGARIFGNLLDPNSEIRYVLKNKAVFRLKEDLGTEPKFWYFRDR